MLLLLSYPTCNCITWKNNQFCSISFTHITLHDVHLSCYIFLEFSLAITWEKWIHTISCVLYYFSTHISLRLRDKWENGKVEKILRNAVSCIFYQQHFDHYSKEIAKRGVFHCLFIENKLFSSIIIIKLSSIKCAIMFPT